jgi:hypothetical protein
VRIRAPAPHLIWGVRPTLKRMNQIDRTVAALRGKPAWGVKKGYASFLTLEFGEPRLIVREPIRSSIAHSARVRRSLERRHVYVKGQCHLWIYMCDWKVTSGGRLIGDSTSGRRISRAAQFIDGQALTDIILPPRGARTRFVFDLGGVLETRPFDRGSEQWLLFEPSGHVLTFRVDRQYSYGDAKKHSAKWRAA